MCKDVRISECVGKRVCMCECMSMCARALRMCEWMCISVEVYMCKDMCIYAS